VPCLWRADLSFRDTVTGYGSREKGSNIQQDMTLIIIGILVAYNCIFEIKNAFFINSFPKSNGSEIFSGNDSRFCSFYSIR
jgi:hypothetical protein